MSLPGFTADSSLYQRETHYQLRGANAGLAEDRKGEVYLAWVFRGCYQAYDCWAWESYGYTQGLWRLSVCDSRYCSGGYLGLVTDR